MSFVRVTQTVKTPQNSVIKEEHKNETPTHNNDVKVVATSK